MKEHRIRRILRQDGSEGAIYDHIKRVLPDVEEERIDAEGEKRLYAMTMTEGKQEILLSKAQGSLLKPCPGTDESYLCCNYWVLNQSSNCPIDCSYCILQYYLTNPVLTQYTNLEDMKEDIRKKTDSEPGRFLRIGTGELADSLAMDHLSGAAESLIRFAAEERRFLLELKGDALAHHQT